MASCWSRLSARRPGLRRQCKWPMQPRRCRRSSCSRPRPRCCQCLRRSRHPRPCSRRSRSLCRVAQPLSLSEAVVALPTPRFITRSSRRRSSCGTCTQASSARRLCRCSTMVRAHRNHLRMARPLCRPWCASAVRASLRASRPPLPPVRAAACRATTLFSSPRISLRDRARTPSLRTEARPRPRRHLSSRAGRRPRCRLCRLRRLPRRCRRFLCC